ncbi:Ltp family lipoprotein [Mycobacterium sp. SMC-13]|jgi:hypothetical protein|uniref:Ltp family lipoprotein n=1 Tax=Mycobacterium sp. SMC-13 TaxID=3381626 RepID=UPI0038779694
MPNEAKHRVPPWLSVPAALLVMIGTPIALPTPASPLTPAAASPGTTAQSNAVRVARDYLSIQGFSYDGLIGQLEFDGFSTDVAIAAVDSLTVDWNEQAAKVAASYLDIQGFSRSGLIEQLEFDGFTPSQARYGVTAAGY